MSSLRWSTRLPTRSPTADSFANKASNTSIADSIAHIAAISITVNLPLTLRQSPPPTTLTQRQLLLCLPRLPLNRAQHRAPMCASVVRSSSCPVFPYVWSEVESSLDSLADRQSRRGRGPGHLYHVSARHRCCASRGARTLVAVVNAAMVGDSTVGQPSAFGSSLMNQESFWGLYSSNLRCFSSEGEAGASWNGSDILRSDPRAAAVVVAPLLPVG